MKKTSWFLFLFCVLLVSVGCSHKKSQQNKSDILKQLVLPSGVSEMQLVFEPGQIIGDETIAKTFQPSYVVTEKGTMLVFCQGRLQGGEDNGPKVILMNTSYDYGKSWQGVRVLSAPMNHFAMSPYSSPTESGERISFLTCVGLKVTKRFYKDDFYLLKEKTGIDLDVVGTKKAAVLCKYYSDDDGATWKLDVLTGDKTPLYKNYNGHTAVFVNTIGQVHKIPNGPYAGRYVLAAPIYTAPKGEPLTDNFRRHSCAGSGILYSDNNGETWRMDGIIADYLGNEASAVSIKNGSQLLMIRRYMDVRQLDKNPAHLDIIPKMNERIAHTSDDGGKTWSEPFLLNMSSVRCHGTLAKVNNRLYFSIPNGIGEKEKINWDDDRVNGSIYFSDDDGVIWKHKVIEPGYFSYSTVGKLVDEYMITFYARGGHGDKGIGYRIFTDEWLDKKENISE